MLYHFYLAVIVRATFSGGKRNSTPFSFTLSSPKLTSFLVKKRLIVEVEKKVALGLVTS
jgi:hypothetical protein